MAMFSKSMKRAIFLSSCIGFLSLIEAVRDILACAEEYGTRFMSDQHSITHMEGGVVMDKIAEFLQGPQGPAVAAGALLLSALAGGLLALKARSVAAVFAITRRGRRGRRLEGRAGAILENQGFTILGEQVPAKVRLRVDGEPFESTVHADFIVRRGGRILAADSKSGAAAENPAAAGVRRQLLEYCLLFDCDGALLVDMEERQVREVEFETDLLPERSLGPAGFILLVLIAAAGGAFAGAALF
jgi:hypothetical protein